MLALLRRHGPTVFGLLLLVAALYVVQHEFRNLSWADIRTALDAIPTIALWKAAGWTLLAYAVLTVYDRLGSVYAGYPVSYLRTSLASFCAYTLAHNLGVAAVSGAAVRYRFYAAWGLPPAAIAKVVAFTSLTFGLGGFFLGGLVLFIEPEVLPWFAEHTPHWVMWLVGIGLWAIVGAYVLASRFVPHFTIFGHRIDLPGWKLAIAQVTLATIDVAVTAMIFYALLPPADGLTFIRFMGIYLAAYTAGLAASVPGGIGVFDGFILLALQPFLPTPVVVGALLLFRLYYYIVPLFLAGGLFAAFEIGQRRDLLGRMSTEGGVTGTLEVPALSGLAGIGGLVLVFIGALPPRAARTLDGVLEMLAGAASHFAASVVGSLLLVAAYGLLRRLRIAWWGTLVLLLNGALITWLRGESWWLTGAFLLVAGLLAASHGDFYRRARLTAEPLSGETVFALAAGAICAITLATFAYRRQLSGDAWWDVVLAHEAPNSLRFTVGLAVLLLLVATFRLLRPARIEPLPYDAATQARLRALGAGATPQADGAFFSEDGRAGLSFVKREGVWLALGDPVGEENARIALAWRFNDLCQRHGVDAGFWRAHEAMLKVYADLGMVALPLPEEDEGKLYLVCRAERDFAQLAPLLPG
jgi:uncharacterized membrane protein YbhN (UPF0104 family)